MSSDRSAPVGATLDLRWGTVHHAEWGLPTTHALRIDDDRPVAVEVPDTDLVFYICDCRMHVRLETGGARYELPLREAKWFLIGGYQVKPGYPNIQVKRPTPAHLVGCDRD
jgi:hypothetical protein